MTRVKDGKAHTYRQLVRSERVSRKVVQQTVGPVGFDAREKLTTRARQK